MAKPIRIMATLGPACSRPEILNRILQAGADMFRLNLSHGSHEEHRQVVETVRDLAQTMGLRVEILADLMGPRFRLGQLPAEGVRLDPGDVVCLGQGYWREERFRIPVDGPGVLHTLRPGSRILIDHGMVELQVVNRQEEELEARVIDGGTIFTRKGINLPDLEMPIAVSAKDREDIRFAMSLRLELLAGSYIGRPEDVSNLRSLAEAAGGAPAIAAKLERALAIQNLQGIIESADLLLVARGDLGVEVPMEQVPFIQKKIIEKSRAANRPVIVATHLLESMVRCPRPTRAEVSDVANAVLDGAQVLLLTGETAAGQYPVEAVETIVRIVKEAESYSCR